MPDVKDEVPTASPSGVHDGRIVWFTNTDGHGLAGCPYFEMTRIEFAGDAAKGIAKIMELKRLKFSGWLASRKRKRNEAEIKSIERRLIGIQGFASFYRFDFRIPGTPEQSSAQIPPVNKGDSNG